MKKALSSVKYETFFVVYLFVPPVSVRRLDYGQVLVCPKVSVNKSRVHSVRYVIFFILQVVFDRGQKWEIMVIVSKINRR
jgi:hypothetical protein